MFKIEYTNEELANIKSKIHFTPFQERIIEYRQNEYTVTKMAFLEHCSESTINREIKKVKRKFMKVT